MTVMASCGDESPPSGRPLKNGGGVFTGRSNFLTFDGFRWKFA